MGKGFTLPSPLPSKWHLVYIWLVMKFKLTRWTSELIAFPLLPIWWAVSSHQRDSDNSYFLPQFRKQEYESRRTLLCCVLNPLPLNPFVYKAVGETEPRWATRRSRALKLRRGSEVGLTQQWDLLNSKNCDSDRITFMLKSVHKHRLPGVGADVIYTPLLPRLEFEAPVGIAPALTGARLTPGCIWILLKSGRLD